MSDTDRVGWTHKEYVAAPEMVTRLHGRILDMEAEVERLRGLLAEVDAHYSGSLDHQPGYVKRIRAALAEPLALNGRMIPMVPLAAFEDLLEEAKDMRGYVPDYFAQKWHHDEALDRASAVLAAALKVRCNNRGHDLT